MEKKEEKRKKAEEERRPFPSCEPLLSTGNEPRTIEEIVKALENEDPKVRLKAVEALKKAAKKGQNISAAIPKLIELLKDRKKYVRVMVVEALGEAALQGNKEAIEGLIKALEDKNESGRQRVAWMLAYVADNGGDISNVIPKLKELLEDEDEDIYVIEGVIKALEYAAEKGQDISEAIEALKKIAKGYPLKYIREAAKDALNAAGIQE